MITLNELAEITKRIQNLELLYKEKNKAAERKREEFERFISKWNYHLVDTGIRTKKFKVLTQGEYDYYLKHGRLQSE